MSSEDKTPKWAVVTIHSFPTATGFLDPYVLMLVNDLDLEFGEIFYGACVALAGLWPAYLPSPKSPKSKINNLE